MVTEPVPPHIRDLPDVRRGGIGDGAGMKLDPGEKELGKWTVNYRPSDGGRYVGELVVTDQRAAFTAKYDTSDIARTAAKMAGLATISTIGAASYGVNATDGGDLTINIPRRHIRQVSQVGGALSKSVVVETADGASFEFHYGLLSVKKILTTLQGATP